MEMPTVSESQTKLAALFSGVWRGEETLHPSQWDPKGGPAFGTWVVHPSLDGFALVVDYTEERDGKIVYRGHGIHTWSQQDNCFYAYWFDNIGIPPKAPSKAKLDGNRYSYGEPGSGQRMTYSWTDGRFEFRIDTSHDGGTTWKPMHEGRYSRVL